jgi:hypothetical protein
MNIELRWVQCASHDDGAVMFADGYCYKQQYRTPKLVKWISEDGCAGGAEERWSDWTDVPVEVEK